MSDRRICEDEAALDPGLEIVDSHHHLWTGRSLPGRVRSDYLLDDLILDISGGHHIVQTVYVECGQRWDLEAKRPELMPVSEVVWVDSMAEAAAARGRATVAGIIGHVDLRHGRSAGAALDAMREAAPTRFVGIRHAIAWNPDPATPINRACSGPHLSRDETWRVGFAEVALRDLAFDTVVWHPQIPELASLAAAFPETSIVVNHLGVPLSIGTYANQFPGVLAECRTSLKALTAYPNIYLKLGGIGMHLMSGPWNPLQSPSSRDLEARWKDHITWCIDAFGSDHCMFESNFPVDSETCSYNVLWNTYKRIAADASPTERENLFSKTARTVYRLGQPSRPLPQESVAIHEE